MRKKFRRLWRSTKKVLTTSFVLLSSRSKIGFPSVNLYRSIHELPLANFIRCDVEGDLTALIVTGKPRPYELHSQWQQLKDQFASSVGDKKYALRNLTLIKLAELKTDFSNAESLINLLRRYYAEKIAIELNRILKSNLKFDYTNRAQYEKDLARARNMSRSIKINMDLKQIELDTIAGDQSGKPTREWYANVLVNISDMAGYRIDDRISTYEFTRRLRDLQEYNSRQKQAKK